MTNDPKNDPAARMRKLTGNLSPLARLPKKGDAASSFDDGSAGAESSAPSTGHSSPGPASVFKGHRFNFGPPFWTIASVISLAVNVVLAVLLYSAWANIPTIDVSGVKASVTDMGAGLLGGLYTNFEKMDRAHIIKTIPVQTTIPVKFDLPINQQTNVILSQDVTIDNALVTVRTGGLNITRALTTIVLPQGTNLPIVLNLTVPVETTVPVSLNVEVDIPLSETQLHEPFVGLRQVVEPFYCMINPFAQNLDGQLFCK